MVPRLAVVSALIVGLVGVVVSPWLPFKHDDLRVVHRSFSTLRAADESGEANPRATTPNGDGPTVSMLPAANPTRRPTGPRPGGLQKTSGLKQKGQDVSRHLAHLSAPKAISPASGGADVAHPSVASGQDGGQVAQTEPGYSTLDGSQQLLQPILTAPSGEATRVQDALVRPPVLLSGALPQYPESAYYVSIERASLVPGLQRAIAEGRVMLRLLLLATGRVSQVTIAQSSGVEALDDAAVKTAQQWRFAPATSDGVPIEAWVVIPIRFVVN